MFLGVVDHLIYAAPSLEAGMDDLERRLGVRPAMGGKHKHFGTHNALVSLGGDIYMEVLAPDPDAAAPDRGILFDLHRLEKPCLLTWVMRVPSVEEVAERAARGGLSLGDVSKGGRENPDGSVISWTVTDPYAFPFDGIVPFLIDWGDTPHPSGVAPAAGELVGLRFEHPDPDGVRLALDVLGADIGVTRGPLARIVAAIKVGRDVVVLE